MKIISTRFHGVLDYLMGLTFLILPAVMNWDQPENTLLMALGAATIFVSLLTDYEMGAFRVLPMGVHLVADIMVALTLIIAPMVTPRIDSTPGAIMIGLGITELLAVALTQTRPSDRPAHHATSH